MKKILKFICTNFTPFISVPFLEHKSDFPNKKFKDLKFCDIYSILAYYKYQKISLFSNLNKLWTNYDKDGHIENQMSISWLNIIFWHITFGNTAFA